MTRGRRSKSIERARKKVLVAKSGFEIQSAQAHIVGGVCGRDRVPELQFAADP
jgi:hypothetical protein